MSIGRPNHTRNEGEAGSSGAILPIADQTASGNSNLNIASFFLDLLSLKSLFINSTKGCEMFIPLQAS
jgi:hypothetical protein